MDGYNFKRIPPEELEAEKHKETSFVKRTTF
jgi:hypothetical protein